MGKVVVAVMAVGEMVEIARASMSMSETKTNSIELVERVVGRKGGEVISVGVEVSGTVERVVGRKGGEVISVGVEVSETVERVVGRKGGEVISVGVEVSEAG